MHALMELSSTQQHPNKEQKYLQGVQLMQTTALSMVSSLMLMKSLLPSALADMHVLKHLKQTLWLLAMSMLRNMHVAEMKKNPRTPKNPRCFAYI